MLDAVVNMRSSEIRWTFDPIAGLSLHQSIGSGFEKVDLFSSKTIGHLPLSGATRIGQPRRARRHIKNLRVSLEGNVRGSVESRSFDVFGRDKQKIGQALQIKSNSTSTLPRGRWPHESARFLMCSVPPIQLFISLHY